jgi:putative phage-type endonuclease
MQQGGEEWRLARCGHITASRLHAATAKGARGGYLSTRQDVIWQVIEERLTGIPAEVFQTYAMRWGTETEPAAIAAAELICGFSVEPAGYVQHSSIPMTGASPDGLIGQDGLIEVKCPTTKTHLQTLLNGRVPEQYRPQMQWQLACTGRDWVQFVSFDPRLPVEYQLFLDIERRDEEVIAMLSIEIELLESEIKNLMEQIKP